MPSFSKAGTVLLLLVMASSILTLITTTVVVAASSATTGGDTNDLSLMRKIKNSKKTNANANANKDDTCTMEPFLGTSMYINCKHEEMEVNIACAKKGNAAADGTPTKKMCSYSEQPVLFDEDEAAAAEATAGCGDHGFFDPETHLTRDHATGVCRLNFVALTDSCDAEAGASRKFGVMIEILPSTGTGPHNHENNEDKNHKDNSGMLLRFSDDDGMTYYNNEHPRKTVLFHGSSPRRTLFENKCGTPSCGTFGGKSTIDRREIYKEPFETCFEYGEHLGKYCWSTSYKNDYGHYYICAPTPNRADSLWKAIDDYIPSGCGGPCSTMYEYG